MTHRVLLGLFFLFGTMTGADVLATSPEQPACGKTEAKSKAISKRALLKAQKQFPQISLRKPVGRFNCFCRGHRGEYPCRKKDIYFERFSHFVKKHNVRFAIDAVAHWFDDDFNLLPFSSQKEAQSVARQIRNDEIIRRAFVSRPLHCIVSESRATCQARKLSRNAGESVNGNMGSAGIPRVYFSTAYTGRSRLSETVEVTNFALPSSQVSQDAPGWDKARQHPEVKKWTANHPNYWVMLNTWHRTFIVLAEQPNAKEGLTVLFKSNKRNPYDKSEIILVRPGTKCNDCFRRFDGD